MDARAWNRLTAPIMRRIKLLVTRAVVKLVDPEQLMQELQVEALAGEVLDGVEHFEPYGFTSHPLAGAEVLLLSAGGRRAHALAGIVADRRYRLKSLAAGEVALYTDEGDVIHFKRGRTIEVTAGTKVKVTAPTVEVVASSKVTITSPLTEMSQNVTVGGTLQVTGQITGQGGLAVSGGSGAQVTGNITATGGNIVADGIGLKTHVHGGVQPGVGTTGVAQ
jgi:phage baseplate assembly protein V